MDSDPFSPQGEQNFRHTVASVLIGLAFLFVAVTGVAQLFAWASQ